MRIIKEMKVAKSTGGFSFKITRPILILTMLAVFSGNSLYSVIAGEKSSQTYYARNNEQIYAVISQREINRINLAGEKIESLHFTQDEMEYIPSGSDLFIKLKTEKPVNFFLKTESGRTYQFLFAGADTPSVQIFIKPKLPIRQFSIKAKEQLSYTEKEINKIIRVAEAETEYMGYKVKKLRGKKYKISQSHSKATLIVRKVMRYKAED